MNSDSPDSDQTPKPERKTVKSEIWTLSYGGYDLHITPDPHRVLKCTTPQGIIPVSISITPAGLGKRAGERGSGAFSRIIPDGLPEMCNILMPRGPLGKPFREVVDESLNALFMPLAASDMPLANPPASAKEYREAAELIGKTLDEAYPAKDGPELGSIYTPRPPRLR
jgi:hypothetical protein